VQNVVTYDVVIGVSNPDLKLRPGMTANASIIIARNENVLKIPNAAFRFKPPEPSTNKTFSARLLAKIGLGGNTKTSAPAAKNDDTNKVAAASAELPLTGNEPPQELQRRVSEMRARGDEVPAEIRAKLREYYQSGALQRPNGGGGGGSGARASGSQPSTRPVYVLATNSPSADEPTPQAVRVKAGISDGAFTEITDGLKEGDVVITAIKYSSAASAAPAGTSPFGGGRRF
jgi:HlyD family secretion protein